MCVKLIHINLIFIMFTYDAETQTVKASSPILFEIENFQEVTTVDENIQNIVAFSFDFISSDSNNGSFKLFTGGSNNHDIIRLQWETVNSSSIGLITLTAENGGWSQGHNTSEGAVQYRFTVNVTDLGEGPLLLTLSVKLQCSLYEGYRCMQFLYRPKQHCTCTQWQYKAESETILVSAKRGESGSHVHSCMLTC